MDEKAPLAFPGARIGLLGGSFNPAHEGHRHISLVALRRLKLDRIWWLVSPQNPLKAAKDMAPLANRLSHARSIARHPRIVVTALEAQLGTIYTIDTLEALKCRFPSVHFVFVMGADNFVELPRWHRWRDIIACLPIGVVARPGFTLSALTGRAAHSFSQARLREEAAPRLAKHPSPAWIYLTAPLNPQSATALREAGAWKSGTP